MKKVELSGRNMEVMRAVSMSVCAEKVYMLRELESLEHILCLLLNISSHQYRSFYFGVLSFLSCYDRVCNLASVMMTFLGALMWLLDW